MIGAVLIPGALAPKLVTREMVAGMKDGAVIADVAIDQGGCFETSRPTTHSEPVYTVDGVTHYCVANMPGAVPVTSTKALTNATLPYVEAIADHGLREAVARDRALARGVNVLDGQDHVRGRRRGPRPRLHAPRGRAPARRRSRRTRPGSALSGFSDGEILTTTQVTAGRERDHAGCEDDDPDEAEGRVHARPRIARMPRACVIVLDAVGAGALPDAAEYGDDGSDTLGNVARAVGGLDLPNLEALGLGNVEPLEGCPPQPGAPAIAGRLLERSKGKDTTTGHWELMGIVTPSRCRRTRTASRTT